MKLKKQAVWFWGLVLLLYGVLWFTFARMEGVFFGGDMGLKFIQIQSLARGQWEIGYPGKTIDPQFRYFPDIEHIIKLREGVTTTYLNLFTYIALLFYRAAGWAGLFLMPCLVTVLILILSFKISSTIPRFSPYLTVILLGFCSPVFFMSVVLQEHTLAALFFLLAIASLTGNGVFEFTKQRCFLSGIFLALASLARPEGILLVVAWLLGLFLVKKELPLKLKNVFCCLGGVVLIVVPYLLLELLLWGKIVEFVRYEIQHRIYDLGLSDWFRSRFYYLFNHVFGLATMTGNDCYPYLSLSPLLLLVVLALPRLRKNRGLLKTALLLSLLVLLVVTVLVIFRGLWIRGLVYTTPYLLLIAFFSRSLSRSTSVKFLLTVSGYYFLFIIITIPNVGGLQWGPRYLIPIYPCLVMVTGFCWENRFKLGPTKFRKYVVGAGVILVILSLLIQIKGLSKLYHKKSERSIARVMDNMDTDTWITYLFYFPQEAAARFYKNKMFFFLPTRESLVGLLTLLEKSGESSFGLVGHSRHLVENTLRPLVESTTGFRQEGDGATFEIFDLNLYAFLYRKGEVSSEELLK